MKTIAILLSLISLPAFAQGPLTPPSGSPAPTQKSLQQIWDKIETLEQENATLRQEVALNQEATVTGLEALFVDQGIDLPWKSAMTDIPIPFKHDFEFHPTTGWPVVVARSTTRLSIWEYDGSAWNETQISAASSGRNSQISLAFSSGQICVAYLDGTSVKFAYGSSSGTFEVETVGQSNSDNAHLSLAVSFSRQNPEVGISFLSDTDDLAYASKPTYNSMNAWTVVTVDSVGDVGGYTSLFFDRAALPNIAYHDFTSERLKGAARSSNGTWTTFVLDATQGAGVGISALQVSNPTNGVAYSNDTNDELRYLTYTGNGASIAIETLDPNGGFLPSLAVNLSQPAIAYRTSSTLKLATRSSSTGPWTIETVTLPGIGSSSGQGVLDFRQDNRPAIAMEANGKLSILHPGLFPSLK